MIFVTQSKLDVANRHLTLFVSSDGLNELKVVLSKDKTIGKAFINTAKTYSFLYWMNMNGQYHIAKRILPP